MSEKKKSKRQADLSRENIIEILGIQEQDIVGVEILDTLRNVKNLAVLAIGQSGIRCAEIVRILRGKRLTTAKLFAKHLKLEDQKKELRENNPQAAAGTPNRLFKLAEEKEINPNQLQIVVIDLVPDVKQFTLLTQPQVKTEAMKFIETFVKPNLKSLGGKGKIQIVFLEKEKEEQEQDKPLKKQKKVDYSDQE
jgi:hypothetical protein